MFEWVPKQKFPAAVKNSCDQKPRCCRPPQYLNAYPTCPTALTAGGSMHQVGASADVANAGAIGFLQAVIVGNNPSSHNSNNSNITNTRDNRI